MPRHNVNGIEIETVFVNPPLPIRSMDWAATERDYDLGRPVGAGATEQAAIDDLIAQLEE